MSFTPYEHVAGHNSPVYVGETTLQVDSEEDLMRSTNVVNKMVLGKRKISGPFVPPPPLKGLEHATSERTSPSGSLKRNVGLATSPATSCNTTTKPKVVTRDPRNSSTRRASTTELKVPERSRDPRRPRSHKEGGPSPFVGPHSSPLAQKDKPSSPVKPLVEPSTRDCGDPKIRNELARPRSPTKASSPPQNLTLDVKVDNDTADHHFVNISVGANRKVYRVHRKLLCQYSEFCRLRFQETQPSSASDEIVLPTTEEKAFDSVLRWLYHGNLGHVTVGINRLYLIYYLAEELGISLLGNQVMDTIRERYRSNPSPGLSYPGIGRIQEVYRRTTRSSPLRRFVVQAAYWKVMKEGTNIKYYTAGPHVPEEFVHNFLKATREKVGDGRDDLDPRSCVPCTFHIHEDGSKCGIPTAAKP